VGVTVQGYVRVLREQWIIVVSAVLIAIGAAGAAWFTQPPEYTAQLTMYVSAQAGETTNAFQGAQLSQDRVASYVELVSSARVSREVIDELGLTATPETLAGQVTASSAPDSVLIDVAVVDRDPEQAAEVANAVGTEFTALVDELERPSSPSGVSPVAVRVVAPASTPTAPSSTGLSTTLVLGLLAGLVVGVGAALARSAWDTSVKSPDQLREVAQAPTLGVIAFDASVPKRPLTVRDDPHSPLSEAFRQLRTNLQFVDVDTPRKVILVTSALPGEGKTTTLCNLALALAAAGSRVLVLEADLRHPRLADLLGLERDAGLTSILAGLVRTRAAVQQWSGGVFDVVTSGPLPSNPSELLASRQMTGLLADFRRQYDVVLVDSPPLLPVTDAAAVAPATDGAIVVCRVNETTSDQLRTAVEALRGVSATLLGTVLTMAPGTGPRASGQYRSYYRTDLPVVSLATPPDEVPPPSPRPRPSPLRRGSAPEWSR